MEVISNCYKGEWDMDKNIKLDGKEKQDGFNRRLKRIILVSLIVALTCIYLFYAWRKYESIQIRENLKLAESIASLFHTEHIESIVYDEGNEEVGSYLEKSLINLIETTDSIYYAYLLKEEEDGVKIVVDSARAESGTSKPIRRTCEEAEGINQLAFKNKESLITDPVTTKCGSWLRVLTPLYDEDGENIIGVLGLNYSASEWKSSLYKDITPDVIIIIFINLLIYAIFLIYNKSLQLIESERAKSVVLSQLPGMAYRCKNDKSWTMEVVSEGSFELTGYRPEELIDNKAISYNKIISSKHLNLIRAEWERVLRQRKSYSDEYEIITKNGEPKWVLEKGQGIFDDQGKLLGLEGIILDITDKKVNEYHIKNLKDHDLLTGLYNRSYMERELNILDKNNLLPISLAICDIDGLAVVNDSYGHEEGDKLIIRVAKLIETTLPEDYILGHLGGGEFLIYLPHIDRQAIKKLKLKIKNKVEEYNKLKRNESYITNISIGYATKENDNEDIREKLKDAEIHLKRRKLLNRNSSHSGIVQSIMATLYAKSHETEEHGQRLGEFCLMVAEKLELSQVEIDELHLLSKLHDIGKIGIDDSILNKPGKLTDAEWVVMKQHPEIGYRIAMSTLQLEHIAEFILYHHERWDGKGYPEGLSGEEIPLISRILSLADAYDAMTEDRIYRKALSKEEAIKEIDRNAGGQFDPRLAKIFIGLLTD